MPHTSIYILIIGSLVHLFAWTYVFAINRSSPLSKAYLFYIGTLLAWLILDLTGRIIFHQDTTTLAYLRLMSVFWLYLGIGILHFIYVFIDKKFDIVFKFFASLYPAALLLSFTTNMTIVPSFLFLPTLMIVIIAPAIYGIYLITDRLVKTKNVIFSFQLKLMIAGIIFAIIVALSTDVIPIYLGIDNPWRLGSTVTCIQAFFILPAILKYHFIAFPVGEVAFGLFTDANEAIIAVDNRGIILRTNNKANQLFNIIPEDIPHRDISDFILRYDISKNISNMESSLKENPNIFIAISQTNMKFGGYEQGKILIIRDITERVQTASDLKSSEEKYRTLIESSSDIIYHLDIDGKFVYVNPVFESFSGYTIDEIIGSDSALLIREDYRKKIQEKFAVLFQRRKEKKIPNFIVTIPTITKEKSEYWMELNVQLIVNRGWVNGFAIVSRDVTERLQAENLLKASEERFRSLIETSMDGIVIHDVRRTFYINESGARIIGQSSQQLKKNSFLKFVHPRDKDKVRAAIKELSEGKPYYQIDISIVQDDGSEVIVEANGSATEYHSKPAIQTFIRDITDRIHAANELRASRERLDEAQKMARIGSFQLNLINKQVIWSDALYNIYDQDKDNYTPTDEKFMNEVVHSDDRDYVYELVTNAFENKETTLDYFHKIITPGGKIKIMHALAEIIYDGNNTPLIIIGSAQDVTELHTTRLKLMESEKNYRELVELSPDAVVIFDTEKILYVNRAFIKMMGGTDSGQFLNQGIFELIHPDSMETSTRDMDKLFKGEPIGSTMLKVFKLNEDLAHVELKGMITSFNGDDAIMASIRDITDKVIAEEQLRESQLSLSKAQEIAQLGSWEYQYDKQKLIFSDECRILFGFNKEEEITVKKYWDTLHPDDLEWVKTSWQLAKSNYSNFQAVYRIIYQGGKIRYVREQAEFITDENGVLINAIGTVLDITDATLAEQQLRESEKRLGKAQEIAHLGGWDENHETGEIYWSEEFRRIFGVDLDEKIGQGRFWDFVHPDDLDWMKKRWIQAEKEMVPYQGVFRILLKDGTVKYINETAEFIQNADGKLLKSMGTIHDETQVREYQDQLRKLSSHLQNLQEEERGRIAREIHDELGQNLTSINMDIEYLKNRGKDGADEKILSRLKSLGRLVDHTIQTTRRISQELRPSILDDLGLKSAIEWQVSQFKNRSNLKYHVNIPEDEDFSKEQSTAIFRITQEALTNIARHADASEVDVQLQLNSSTINLEIKDNGKGFSENGTKAKTHFGIFGMKERASMLGGSLSIFSTPKKGTRVNLELPLKNKERTES